MGKWGKFFSCFAVVAIGVWWLFDDGVALARGLADGARGALAETKMRQFDRSLHGYEAVKNYLPQAEDELRDVASGQPGKELLDPWGKSYSFELLSRGYLISSAGPDGQFRTVDDLHLERESESLTFEPGE